MNAREQAAAYSGRSRRKQTPWRVRAADSVAKWLIAIGGIGTIVAVSTVFLFLFYVAAPLFLPASLTQVQRQEASWPAGGFLASGLDEFRGMYWRVSAAGDCDLFRIDNGQHLQRRRLVEGEVAPTAMARSLESSDIAVGAGDGTVRLGKLEFRTTVFSTPDSLPPEASGLRPGEWLNLENGVLQRTFQGPWRAQALEITWSAPVSMGPAAIRHLDHLVLSGEDELGAKRHLIAAGTAEGHCRVSVITEEENEFTGEKSLAASDYELPSRRDPAGKLVRILLGARGQKVYLAWEDGLVQRFDLRDLENIQLAEESQVLRDAGARLTACSFLLGRETLVFGDSVGGLRAWFCTVRAPVPASAASDGQKLTMAHDLRGGQAAVTALDVSQRGRSVVAGDANGIVRVFQVTTEKRVLETRVGDGEPIQFVAFAPKEDGLLAATPTRRWTAEFDPRHPDVTWASLFRPVWYEGYDAPRHIWQSSAATTAPESKLGLMPLVFGTLKATSYTMLFAAPLALLAAIYTSEFMHPRTRGIIKPVVEMMASLPSVVLGFLAALVFAPAIEGHLTATIATLFMAPVLYLLFAHFWQALPQRYSLRWQPVRLALLFLPLPLGVVVALRAEESLERWLFAGDIRRWLDGQIGSGVSAWLLLWLPCGAVLTALAIALWINPLLRGLVDRCSRTQYVWLSLTKFFAAIACTLGLAAAASWLLVACGWDPRGSFVGTYDNRNALVVGAVMGFAVIPIMYTIADDALSTVPQHLRSASLGCGATPWQTAIRVVVPTAMSGLFSALIIGLGRAVGETMIVLMAGGNTPVMDWNVFNGFRTLSANLATELPEAVRGSTHYRTLFFAALTLFMLTFCLNTVAELVRLRFRKRAFQL